MTEALGMISPGIEQWLIVIVPLFLVAYFIPFFVAAARRHRFKTAIGLINLLLGWTIIGWLAAMIWAVNRDVGEEQGELSASSGPLTYLNEPSLNERSIGNQASETGPTRKCQFCAEAIKAEALVCRYCGRDVEATATGARQGGPVNAATMEQTFEELQALLKDREENSEQRLADVEPAMNYVAPEEEEKVESERVSAEVVQQLSGWKKFG